MTKEELENLIPPIPLARVQEGLRKAQLMGESYTSRVTPYVPEDYDNSTSETLYSNLKAISDAKEAKLASSQ